MKKRAERRATLERELAELLEGDGVEVLERFETVDAAKAWVVEQELAA